MNKPRVLLGMSGGVDSSVSAILLLEQGYDVVGAFMKNWSDGEPGTPCTWREERRDAMRVAAELGIDFHTFDFEDLYRKDVYEYMIAEYEKGRTPNPDVMCNKFMKFGYLLEKADELDCQYIATGHYARVERDADGTAHLLAGVDSNKDQTYFLCQLKQGQLSRALFPIGELEKPEVRKIAEKHGLFLADKKDSQGICFVGKVNIKQFLQERIPPQTGDILTTSGDKIGEHDGYAYYTIGQRSGLRIGGGTPYFVVDRIPEKNQLIVAVGDEDPALYSSSLVAEDLSETIPGNLDIITGREIKARIRYRQELQDCKVSVVDGDLKVAFKKAQKAVAPGQFIAFYKGEELLGSAVIKNRA